MWSRKAPADVRQDFDQRVLDDRIATCELVTFELLVSARNGDELRQKRGSLSGLPQCAIDAIVWRRALDVYQLLGDQGGAHHRQVNPADVIIAAAAELAGFGVLHYDQHFDRIAAVTRQPTRWLAPQGSL